MSYRIMMQRVREERRLDFERKITRLAVTGSTFYLGKFYYYRDSKSMMFYKKGLYDNKIHKISEKRYNQAYKKSIACQ